MRRGVTCCIQLASLFWDAPRAFFLCGANATLQYPNSPEDPDSETRTRPRDRCWRAAGASKYAYVGRTDFSSSNGKVCEPCLHDRRLASASAPSHSQGLRKDDACHAGALTGAVLPLMNPQMGLTYFGGEPKKANKSRCGQRSVTPLWREKPLRSLNSGCAVVRRLFVVLFVALGLPIIAAAGVVHNVAATAIASPTAPVLKVHRLTTLLQLYSARPHRNSPHTLRAVRCPSARVRDERGQPLVKSCHAAFSLPPSAKRHPGDVRSDHGLRPAHVLGQHQRVRRAREVQGPPASQRFGP